MKIGVLALQEGFKEHRKLLKDCGVKSCEVHNPEHLENIQGLIIPGKDASLLGKRMKETGLLGPVKDHAAEGLPIFGIHGGLVLLAKKIIGNPGWVNLGMMDIEVMDPGAESQGGTFEADLEIDTLGFSPFRGVFIHTPLVMGVCPNVGILSLHKGGVVFARQGNLLACTFHPELTDDLRVHNYFINMVSSWKI
ncbi:MAG: pyridoxal 5'-phosphate synthase glutaminase subunit PdxT [Clostridia bacterium]|nr:pyridoxal 5'-phosphate synthase glutaminase subunit PdxT [Clostridia bacterium]